MRDLILIAGEFPDRIDAEVVSEDPNPSGRDVRFLVNGEFIPLDEVPPGPERAFAVGVAMAMSEIGIALDIVSLGKPGAHLRTNWDATHSSRLFAKSTRMLRNILEAGEHRLAGMLWLARLHPVAQVEDYRKRFETLIQKLKISIGALDLPVCAVAIGSGADERLADYTSDVKQINYTDLSGDERPVETLADCGTALARTLYSTEFDRPFAFRRTIHWLWKSSRYQAWLSVPADADPDDPHYVIAFPHAMGTATSGFDVPGFGQVALERRGVKTVFIRCHLSNWFQDTEILELGHALRRALPADARITSYGASMGAYGALLLSKALNAKRVIAVAPQVSLDKEIVPFERRWRIHRDRIGGFRHNLPEMIAPNAQKMIFYDNIDKDRLHVRLMNPDATFRLYRFPGASHQILRYLKETDCLSDFLRLLSDPDAEFDASYSRARMQRHESPIYWLGIFRHFKSHRQRCAADALLRCMDIEGPKNKYVKRMQKLDDSFRVNQSGAHRSYGHWQKPIIE